MPKKLTEKEIEKMAFAHGKGQADPRRAAVLAQVRALKIGEGVLVTLEDWPGKTPIRHIRKWLGGAEIELRTKLLADKSGWVVQRIA